MRLRDYIGAVARASSENRIRHGYRRVLTGAASLARKAPAELMRTIGNLAEMERLEQDELDRWAEPEEIGTKDGRTRFDVCDLRIWLALARDAGVPAIPAREIANLNEAEFEALLGKVKLPPALRRTIMDGIRNGSEDIDPAIEAQGVASFLESIASTNDEADATRRAFEKIDGVLDDIPASWMVRTQYAGSNNLKALVGTGLMQKADDTAIVRPDFEIGGGWLRIGNRRVIDVMDPRFIETAIGGHKPGVAYLARPWAEAARFHEGEDIHRANSPLAGPGKWPAEWRVFVRAGLVSGVANYYGWTGSGATPENAWNAITAAGEAQAIADLATTLGLDGVFMGQVFLRSGNNAEAIACLDAQWPEGTISCTLDFLETREGMRFLEGGPSHAPGSGGHPCAFAGQGVDMTTMPHVARCEGVAYKSMPHVHLGEPSTWIDGDSSGCIESWQDAAARALDHAPLGDRAMALLDRHGVSFSSNPGPEM